MPPFVITYVASRSGQSVEESEIIFYEAVKYRLTWRVLNLCNALLSSTLAKQDSGRGSVSKDMSTDRFPAVSTGEECAGAGVALDLVCL